MHGNEQIILAGEEVVEGPDRHLGAVDDVLHGEIDAAALGHEFHGSANEAISPFLCPGPRTLQRALDAEALPFGHGVVGFDLVDGFGHLDSCHVTYILRTRRRRISADGGFFPADISFAILLCLLQSSDHALTVATSGRPPQPS